MEIVFLSNFYNHHQMPLSRSLQKILHGNYAFIATTPMDAERRQMGYQEYTESFLYQFEDCPEECMEQINRADAVIFGSAPRKLIQERLKAGKPVFQYSERIFKKKPPFYEIPARTIKYYLEKGRYSNMYLLCASAFTAADYATTHTFPQRAYKWGYFPETKHYQMDALYAQKDKQKILWVGRFLDWKHPDDVLRVAKRLKEDGYSFSMDIAGTGEMEQQLKDMSEAMGLNDCVTFLGPIPSNRVRELMEKAGIYLFTSDRYEGWGAVLNESMNSGCAVVASHAIGAVPYLMRNRENGLIYHSGNVDELYKKVKYLLDNPGEQERLGKAAYETIVGEWNAEVAAERLINLSEHLLAGEKYPDLYRTGPCSRAEIIKDDWFYE